MPELLLNIIEEGLVLINKIVPDQATKIRTEVLDYRRKWDAEMAKGDKRDDALLAMYDRELHDIGQLFLAALKSTQS